MGTRSARGSESVDARVAVTVQPQVHDAPGAAPPPRTPFSRTTTSCCSRPHSRWSRASDGKRFPSFGISLTLTTRDASATPRNHETLFWHADCRFLGWKRTAFGGPSLRL
jgi:hypothetical protein